MSLGKRTSNKSVIQKVSPRFVVMKKAIAPKLTMPQFTDDLAIKISNEIIGDINLKKYSKKQKRYMYGH
jgi:hypothetical protein